MWSPQLLMVRVAPKMLQMGLFTASESNQVACRYLGLSNSALTP